MAWRSSVVVQFKSITDQAPNPYTRGPSDKGCSYLMRPDRQNALPRARRITCPALHRQPVCLRTLNLRFVAWPLDLGLGTLNARVVAWPLELGCAVGPLVAPLHRTLVFAPRPRLFGGPLAPYASHIFDLRHLHVLRDHDAIRHEPFMGMRAGPSPRARLLGWVG